MTALPDREALRLTGADTIPLLQSLVTANVERLGVGEPAHAALLTPQGKVLSAFFVWREADGVLIDAAPGDRDALAARLRLYKLRAAVEIAAADAVAHVGEDGPPTARPDPRLPAMGVRWMAAPDGTDARGAYEARRIAQGVPEFGRDHGPGAVFPMDVNLDALGAVDYKKGCFVGQEVASRMYRKGEVRKRTWTVEADAPLGVGASVTAGGSTLGEITSAMTGAMKGADGSRGLALLRVDRVGAASEPPVAGGVPVRLAPPAYL